MKHAKIITWILTLALLLSCLPMTGAAAGVVDVSVAVSPKTVAVGSQAVVTISLEGYDTASVAGLQVDITGIDPDVLEVMDYTTAIAADEGDAGLMSNQASYNSAKQRVRLLYFRKSGTLPAPCGEVLHMTVRIVPELTGAGNVTLPVTVKVVTEDGRQDTLQTDCTIRYLSMDGSEVACNSDAGVAYDTLAEALDGAGAGETVQLLADCTESLVVIPADAVLDLNGHVVEAGNVVSFGSVIDTADTVGGVRIPFDPDQAFVQLQPENGNYLPIYDTGDGMYRFFRYELKNAGAKTDGNAVKFGIQLSFTDPAAYRVLANTGESGVKLISRLSWSGMSLPGVDYEISGAALRSYAQKKAAEPAKSFAITLKLSGLNHLDAADFVSAAPRIGTAAGVGAEAGGFEYTVG